MDQDETARIRALGEIAAEFDLDAIRVRSGELEIEIVRRDAAVAPVAAPIVVAAPAPGFEAAAPAGGGGELSSAAASAGANVRRVTAPVVGVFYNAAAPGADPFVEVGSRVTVGQTLCILEAMKLMNEIASDYAGTISRCLVENGELVSLGQELFWIDP